MSDGEPTTGKPVPTQAQLEERARIWATKTPADATILAAGLTGVIGFATTAINAAVLLNGAAATAILALVGSVWSSTVSDALPLLLPVAADCIWFFAVGAALAVCAAGFAVLSQVVANSCMMLFNESLNNQLVAPHLPPNGEAERMLHFYRLILVGFRIASALAFIGSVGFFAVGANNGLQALSIVTEAFPRN